MALVPDMKDARGELPPADLALAALALDDIAGTPPALVRSGRRGHVAAAVVVQGSSVVFRRVGDVVRMETWPTDGLLSSSTIAYYALPPFYQKRAASLIDGLPN